MVTISRSSLRTRPLLFLALLLLVAGGPLAQDQTGADDRLGTAEIRERRAAVEADAGIEEDLKKRILEFYDQALSALDGAADSRAAKARLEREKVGIEPRVQALRQALDRAGVPQATELP